MKIQNAMIKDILSDFIKFRKTLKEKDNAIPAAEVEADFVPDDELWQKFLNFVRGNTVSDSQLEELVSALCGKEEISLVKQMKQEIEKNCDYAEDIRRLHPTITATELQVCCYIVQGKTSEEIAQLMGVGISTITSGRCRLRSKLGLKKNRSLKVYLDSVSRLKRERRQK